MKISGTGPPLPPEEVPSADEVKGAAQGGFAEKLERGADPAAVEGAAEAGRPGQAVDPGRSAAVGAVADIAADLRAGAISREAALDRVIDRVLAQQVGPDAPPAVRAQVAAALRQALEDDPLLAQKLRALG
jgi:hypothetical protein